MTLGKTKSRIYWFLYVFTSSIHTDRINGFRKAGLFSAVVTSSVVDSWKDLQPDPIALLLFYIATLIDNTTNGAIVNIPPVQLSPSPSGHRLFRNPPPVSRKRLSKVAALDDLLFLIKLCHLEHQEKWKWNWLGVRYAFPSPSTKSRTFVFIQNSYNNGPCPLTPSFRPLSIPVLTTLI